MVYVRAAAESDLPGIAEVLNDWLLDPATGGPLEGATESRVSLISDWVRGNRPGCQFVVAETSHVIGVGGLQDTNIDQTLVPPGERAVEVITTYVRAGHRGSGVGRAILDDLERRARDAGFSTLIVVSGSRNRESGYPFWRRRYGEPVRWDSDFFAAGAERVVWRHQLA